MFKTVNNQPKNSFRKRRLAWKLPLLGILQMLFFVSAHAQTRVNFNINANNARKPISPLIYGTNDDYPYAKAKRLGGNRITGYNWENNASNSGFDWGNHHSDDYVPYQQGVPEDQYNKPGAALSAFHQRSLNQSAYSLITLPLASYVTRDKNGVVSPEETAPSARWTNVKYRKPGPLSLQPDVADANVYVDEEINYLLHHFGQSNTPTGVKGYALDNEPGLWFHTHPRLWGTKHVSVGYLMDNSFELAQRIKEMDPGAEVYGPSSWGVSEFENLQFAPDWDKVKGSYPTFIDLYLGQMRQKEQQTGKRLLDVLDVHWYPQKDNNGISPFNNGIDYATNAARMAMTRSLWDPTYIENTWIGNDAYKVQLFLPFLPKMHQHINQYYPGTKLAITEYSYMGIKHASGGIAQADALGIFGRQGIYLATYWGGVIEFIKSGFDLYKNYDGRGGHFGDTSVESSTNDLVNTSVHASINGNDDSKLHVIALNKNQDGPVTVTFTANANRQYKSAQVWGFDNTGTALKEFKAVRSINNNTFEYTLSALTACHFILSEDDISIVPEIAEAKLNSSAGYSDGTATFELSVKVSDGNNDLTDVTADFSQVGGANAVALTPSPTEAGRYHYQFQIPGGTSSGLKPIKITANDAAGHRVETTVSYRIIKRTSPTIIWDGDQIRAGQGEMFFDKDDSRAQLAKVRREETGGQNQPGSLYMHFEHGPNFYNQITWRLSDNSNPADARNVSDFGALEFYVKSNAPANADLEVSLRDATAQMGVTKSIFLKQDGYLSSLNNNGYTRVKIPLSAFTEESTINLEQLWQINFQANTANKGFDVWIDDIRVLPYSHPIFQPEIKATSISSANGYADGKTTVTISAEVNDPDHNLSAVSVDLSPLGRSNKQEMRLENGRHVATITIPQGVSKGLKQLNISALDADGNSADGSVHFTVNVQEGPLVLWDGDVVNTGKYIPVNNETSCVVDDNNGNIGPKSMKIHLDMATHGFASAVWDWNENTNDEAIRDLSTKGFLSFYVKVQNPSPNFDLQVLMKDRFAQSTNPVFIRGGGYLTTFTGNYQQVRIPMSAIFGDSKIDKKQMTRFGVLATQMDKPHDLWIDDIVAGGSNVADVKLAIQAAECAPNGSLRVLSINGSDNTSAYKFYLNNATNPAGENVGHFQNLAPGKYELRIEGANDFAYLETVSVGGSGQGLSAHITQQNTNLDLTVSGGSGQYTYQWSNQSTSEDLTNVSPGTYTVHITDQVSGCKAAVSITVSGGTPNAELVVTDANCKPNGSIEVQNVTGSAGNITYYLNGKPNPAGVTNPLFSNLASGDYEIMILGDGEFRFTKTVSVKDKGEKPKIDANVEVANGKGYINLNVTGGSGIYIYKWSEGSETQNLWEVAEGTYEVEVTDAATGCSATASYAIAIPGIELSIEKPSCAPNGKIRVTAVSGLGDNPKYYINGQPNAAGINAAEFAGLLPGHYVIKVEGTNGLSAEKEVDLEGFESAPKVVADVSYMNEKGYINLNVTGGSGIYIYEWSNGATSLNLWEVPAGTYTVVVTDLVSNCKTTHTETVGDGSEGIMIYPNPAISQESVWIKYNFIDNNIRKITVTDNIGLPVYSAAVPEGATEITLPAGLLRSGRYLVTLEGKKIVSKHMIVQ